MKPHRACLVALLAASCGAGAQTLYRWVDPAGQVHYSDQPPPQAIKRVDQPRLGTSTIETSGLPYAARQAAQDFPVTFYTAADCGPECGKARDFLAKRGVPFRERAIATPEDAAAFRQAFGADRVFLPSLTVGSRKAQGFEEGTWQGLLDEAGYPRAVGRTEPASR